MSKGGSIATGRAASVDLATEPRPPRARRHEPQYNAQGRLLPASRNWDFKNAKLSSVGHFQSEQAFTPPTHPLPNVVRIFRKVR